MGGTSLTRPRVLVVAHGWPVQGGIATFADLLVHHPVLAEIADYRLLNTTRQAVRAAGNWSLDNLRYAVADARATYRAAGSADIVHVQASPGRIFPLLRMVALCAAARVGRAAVVCHVHSSRINAGQEDGFAPGLLFRLTLRWLVTADVVATCSRTGTAILRDLMPRHRVETVDNAVDVAVFEPAAPEAMPPTAVFVGTICRRKGVLDLIEAVRDLAGEQKWRLRLIGGAAEVGEAEAEEIRETARGAGFADALVGALAADDVRAELARASVFVLPSHWEGQPIAILEAMAAGLPVVATRIGAIPDVVRDGVDGILVDPHDVSGLREALRTLLSDDELRARMGESARKRVTSSYDVGVLADRLDRLYADARRSAAGDRGA